MDYKDRSKREAVWDKFCEKNNLDKDACQRWFQSQRTLFGKVTHMKLGQGEPQLIGRNGPETIDFLRDNIMHHLTAKSEFRAPRGSASQASGSAAVCLSSRWETVHMEPFQDTSRPYFCDPSDISHLDTHMATTRSRAVNVTSSLADSDLQSALAESQRGISELKDIVDKKLSDYKPDNPRLGFCDFLEVEVVQLTIDS